MLKITPTLILLVLGCLACTLAQKPLQHYYAPNAGLPSAEEFKNYFEEWHKSYRGPGIDKTADREAWFMKRLTDIIRHNQNPHRTFNRTVNRFTGRYLSELAGTTVMYPQNCLVTTDQIKPSTGRAGSSGFHFSWRDKSVVNPIKDQKQCGASYAFAAAAAIESHWGIRTGVPPALTSEQQPIDCSLNYNNSGCEGGLPQLTYQYLQDTSGLSTENTYPFEAQIGQCRFRNRNVFARVYNGSVNIVPGDELAIYQALTTFGPISVGLQVSEDFLDYDGGIYQSTECKNDTLIVNHTVTIIGYGTDDNTRTDYWVAKNSWGTMWGEIGYVRIRRGVNTCGIANCASYPNINYTNPITNSSVGDVVVVEDNHFSYLTPIFNWFTQTFDRVRNGVYDYIIQNI